VAQVRYAVWEGTSWTAETVDPAATGDAGCLSLAVDGAGGPHILYADTTHKNIVLADRDGGAVAWRMNAVRTIGAGEADVLACALALDAGDVPHIAYAISSPGGAVAAFTYAIFNGAGWSTATATAPPVPNCNVAQAGRTMQ